MKRVLALVVALLAGMVARAGPREILMVDERSEPEGTAMAPTKDHPVVYLLILGGYRQDGEAIAGETTLPMDEVGKRVHASLQEAGYTPLRKSSRTPPDLVIVAHWGAMGPGDVDMGDGNPPVSFNEVKMLNLVAGSTMGHYELGSSKRSDLLTAAHQIRYFLVLSAFEYAPYAQHKKKVLVWQARVSAPSNGTSLPAMLPLLIQHGSAIFGKRTPETRSIMVTDVPSGTVTVGAPVEVPAAPASR